MTQFGLLAGEATAYSPGAGSSHSRRRCSPVAASSKSGEGARLAASKHNVDTTISAGVTPAPKVLSIRS